MQKKIGIALAGGGLQGISHIGALMALEELGVKADYISGVSSGSFFAVTYALGYSIEEMKDIAEKSYKGLTNMNVPVIGKVALNYLLHINNNVEGIVSGQKIEDIIDNLAKTKNITNIKQVKKHLAIATVDTVSTKECIFASSEVHNPDENINYIYDVPMGKVVRASMAFPGIYTTCNFNEYNFIDGGTKNNLPVSVLKKMGADKIISISFDIDNYKPSSDLTKVILRALDIFSSDGVRKARKESNVAVIIKNEDTSLLQIKDLNKTINMGYEAVMEKKEEILKEIVGLK